MFIEHIKSNVQSVMTHTPQKPKNAESAGFIMVGKIIDWEIYGGLRPKPPLFLRHKIPSKVSQQLSELCKELLR